MRNSKMTEILLFQSGVKMINTRLVVLIDVFHLGFLFGLSKERLYLVLDPNLIWTCLSVIRCNLAVYNCKLAVYTCKLVVYTCKVLNFRFTTVILITLLDTVEVTPFFQFFCVKQWFTGVTLCGLHFVVYTLQFTLVNLLKLRFTCVLLITLVDTVEITPIFQILILQ